MRLKPWMLIMLVLWLLTGCATRSLSVLQTEFNATVNSMNKCQPGSGSQTIKPENIPCSADFNVVFADIANQTQKTLNGYSGSPQIAIGLHRLHAYAVWQSGANEKDVVLAARPGIEKCNAGGINKTPRDCALLMMVGNFVVAEAAGKEVDVMQNKLKNQPTRADVCKANAVKWKQTVESFMKEAYLPMVEDVKKIASYKSTPESVLNYLKSQLKLTSDQVVKLNTVGIQCTPKTEDQKKLNSCPCFTQGRTGAEQASCTQIANNEVFQFSHAAICNGKDALQSEKCPCNYKEPPTPPKIGEQGYNEFMVCSYKKKNKQMEKLYEAKCLIENALKRSE